MRSRLLRLLLALSFSSCLIAFLGVSINAYALTGGDYISNADALSLFGQTISVRYYQNDGNSSGYVDATASYIGASSVQTMYSDTVFDSVYVGAPFLIYKCATPSISSDPTYITVKANPSFSVVDTDLLYTFIGCSATENTRPSSTFTSPSWNWSTGHYENSATDSNGHKSYFRASTDGDNYPYTFVPVELSTNAAFSAYCEDANFYGNTNGGYGYTYIALGIPYISSSATVHPGTDIAGGSGGSSGSGNINVDVNVDMSETNGLLGTIQSTLSGIVSGVSGLFTVDQNYITNFKQDVLDLFDEVFSPYSDCKDLLDDFAADLLTYGATNSVQFPAINVPNTNVSIASRSVSLIPNGMQSFVNTGKTLINIVCTCMVVNLIMNKVKAILVGEKMVDIEGSD